MSRKKTGTNEAVAPQAPSTAAIRLTQFSHGGGCGCKIAPGVLEQILAKTSSAIVPEATAGRYRDQR
jgi:selenophosphate synthase